MINYKVIARKSPRDKSIKFYAQPVSSGVMRLEDIAKEIEHATTVSSADIKACLDELERAVMRAMTNGYSVRLGDLGSFHISIQSSGTETWKEFRRECIRCVTMKFVPSTDWYRNYGLLKNLSFKRVDKDDDDE